MTLSADHKPFSGVSFSHLAMFCWHIKCGSTTVWVKKLTPLGNCGFLTFFHKWLRILSQLFTHTLHVPIYARLQIFIQLSPTLTKLCHIKRGYLVHIICSKCPPSAEMHAFRRLRESLIALWSLSVASHPRSAAFIMSGNMLDMTWRQPWCHLLSMQA